MAQLEHIEAIEQRLWSAADTLRANSNFASNEYFLPVMGLIFLRHAYSRFLAVKDDIEGVFRHAEGRSVSWRKRISLSVAPSSYSRKRSLTIWSRCRIARTVLGRSSMRWSPLRMTTRI